MDKLNIIRMYVVLGIAGGLLGWISGSLICDYLENRTEEEYIFDPDNDRKHDSLDHPAHTQEKNLKGKNLTIVNNYAEMYKQGRLEKLSIDEESEPPNMEIVVNNNDNLVEDEEGENDIYQVIEAETYFQNPDNYERKRLMFFEGDGMWFDLDRNEVASDAFDLVGENAQEKFGKMTDDEDLVYILNTVESTMFELVRKKGSIRDEEIGNLSKKNGGRGTKTSSSRRTNRTRPATNEE